MCVCASVPACLCTCVGAPVSAHLCLCQYLCRDHVHVMVCANRVRAFAHPHAHTCASACSRLHTCECACACALVHMRLRTRWATVRICLPVSVRNRACVRASPRAGMCCVKVSTCKVCANAWACVYVAMLACARTCMRVRAHARVCLPLEPQRRGAQ